MYNAVEFLKLGYDLEIWYEYHIKQSIDVRLRSHPSLLLTGASGSGKSYALKWLIGNLLDYNVELTFCNFKRSEDFRFLNNYEHYYTYMQCADGLQDFYNRFKDAQNAETEFNGVYNILLFDEYAAFLLMQEKKSAEQYKMMISEILMLGRSYGFGTWLILQRPDANSFLQGARDNTEVKISLGNLSKEAKSMLYSGEELPNRVYKVGEGICWIDGVGLKEIKFPKIADMNDLETKILNRLRP